MIIVLIVIGVLLIIPVIPFICYAVIILWNAFFVKPEKPNIEHGEFPFELVYKHKGEEITIEDTLTCDFNGYSYSIEGGNSRHWNSLFEKDNEYGHYYVDKENYPDLYIVVPDYCEYYMGSKEAIKEYSEPYIHYIDESTGTYYEEKDKVDVVETEIVKWNTSEPLKNNFK